MKELKLIYDLVNSPVEDINIWEKIVNVYSLSQDFDDFYRKINNISNKTSLLEVTNTEREEFLVKCFNIWKNNVLNLNSSQIDFLIKDQVVDNDFANLKDIFLTFGETNSIYNVKKILINPIIKHYFNNFFTKLNNGYFINSHIDILESSEYIFFLSININVNRLYSFLTHFIDVCNMNKLPFLFKYTEKNNSDETFTLYVSANNIKKYIDVLSIIRKEHFSIFGNTLEPDILMGRYKSWLGCGNRGSSIGFDYLESRSNLIFNSIDDIIYNHVINNFNLEINYKAGKLTLKEYICSAVAYDELNKLVNSETNGDIVRYYSINYNEINELREYLTDKLMQNIESVIRQYERLNNEKSVVVIALKNNRVLNISATTLMSAIRRLTPTLMHKDALLLEKLKTRIKNECTYLGIDPVKLCFDKKIIDNLFSEDDTMYRVFSKIGEMKRVINNIKYVSDMSEADEVSKEQRSTVTKAMKELDKIFSDADKRSIESLE